VRGPGFNSRLGPIFVFIWKKYWRIKYFNDYFIMYWMSNSNLHKCLPDTV